MSKCSSTFSRSASEDRPREYASISSDERCGSKTIEPSGSTRRRMCGRELSVFARFEFRFSFFPVFRRCEQNASGPGCRHDPDAAVLTEPQQILIACDDELRPGFHRAFQDSVVVRVFLDGIDGFLRGHEISQLGKLFPVQVQPVRLPREVVTQHGHEFILRLCWFSVKWRT